MYDNKRFFCRNVSFLGTMMFTIIVWVLVRKFDLQSFIWLDIDKPMDSFIEYIVDHGIDSGTRILYQCNANIQNFVILLLCKITGNVSAGVNLFFMFSFFLIATSMYWCLQRYQLPYGVCVFGAVISSLLPYHIDRGEGQIIESNFAAVPIIVVWLYDAFFERKTGNDKKYVLFLCILPFWDVNLSIMTLVLVAFLCILNHEKAVIKRIIVHVVPMMLIIIILCHPWNSMSSEHIESVGQNGIRLLDMIVPIRGHMIRRLYDFRCDYDIAFNASGESGLNSLGTFLSVCFIIGILKLLSDKKCNEIIGWLSWINLAVLLTAYNDGVCILLEYIGIHVEFWNRMAIFIIINTIIIMGLLYKEIKEKYKDGFQRYLFNGMGIVIGIYSVAELMLRQ